MNTAKAEALIKEFEGCKLTAYQDMAGRWTIGYGHTGRDVCSLQTISQELADTLLAHDMERTLALLGHVLPDAFMELENPVNALVSFVFNIGIGQFEKSTMCELIRSGRSLNDIANEFDRWVFSGHVVAPGLLRRRNAEKALLLS